MKKVFDSIDITRETYDLLLHKRVIAGLFEKEFAEEGNSDWFNMLIGQTEYANRPYEEFAKVMSRYIYIVRKGKWYYYNEDRYYRFSGKWKNNAGKKNITEI